VVADRRHTRNRHCSAAAAELLAAAGHSWWQLPGVIRWLRTRRWSFSAVGARRAGFCGPGDRAVLGRVALAPQKQPSGE